MSSVKRLAIKALPLLALLVAPQFIESAIARSDAPYFLCFRKHQSGQVENLERICPRKPIELGEIKNRVRISKDAAKLLKFIEYSYDGQRLVAVVKNRLDKQLPRLSITYTAYNRTSNGEEAIVDTGTVSTQGKSIGAYGQTSFKADLDRRSDFIEITRVETD